MAINEQLQRRLQNLQAIEPILSALRSVSLSKNLTAKRQQAHAKQYSNQLKWLFSQVEPSKKADVMQPRFYGLIKHWFQQRGREVEEGTNRPQVLAIVGSERGLCGRYNREIVEAGLAHINDQPAEIKLWVFGRRVLQLVERREIDDATFRPLSITTLPTFEFAVELAETWLSLYEKRKIDGVDLILNRPNRKGQYKPEVVSVIPPSLSLPEQEPDWPPATAIIETSSDRLYLQLVKQQVAVDIYSLFLEAAETEHWARYVLMEAGAQNAERLLGELQLALQAERRQNITQEMQQLTAGASLR
jgi:F-type H+-transporting ATPase subunit gamma